GRRWINEVGDSPAHIVDLGDSSRARRAGRAQRVEHLVSGHGILCKVDYLDSVAYGREVDKRCSSRCCGDSVNRTIAIRYLRLPEGCGGGQYDNAIHRALG